MFLNKKQNNKKNQFSDRIFLTHKVKLVSFLILLKMIFNNKRQAYYSKVNWKNIKNEL